MTLSGGQTTSATVTFPAVAIAKLMGSECAVFLLPGDSKPEIPTTVTVSLTVSLDAASVALKLGDAGCLETGCTITIAGSNLQEVKKASLVDSDGNPKATGSIETSSTATSLKVKFASLSNITASGDYPLKLQNNGTDLGTVTLKIILMPSIESITPKTWSKAAPGCTDGCAFVLGGQRLAELTNVVLADGDTVKATGTYTASTKTVTFKKSELDALTGDFTVSGKTKDGQSDAISSVKLKVGE